jgi:pimeloyl-ACP methyl ester carboxylesterase
MKMTLFPRLMFALFLFVLILITIVVVSYFVNKSMLAEWLQNPEPPGRVYHLASGNIYATLKGKGDQTVVFISGMGATSAEWWSIQDKLSPEFQSLTYDRPGYTWSTPTLSVDLPKQEQVFLELLDQLHIKGKIILVGHNLGANIAKYIVKGHPQLFKAVIYIDPLLNPTNICSNKTLSPEWKTQFLDQTQNLERYATAARIGILRFINLTPYDVPDSIRQIVLNNLANPVAAETVQKEYSDIVFRSDNPDCLDATDPVCSDKLNIPMTLLRHNLEQSEQLMVSFGASQDVAKTIEELWRKNDQFYLCSTNPKIVTAKKAVFDIHVSEPEIIIDTIKSLAQ